MYISMYMNLAMNTMIVCYTMPRPTGRPWAPGLHAILS